MAAVDISTVSDRVALADAITGKSDDEIDRALVGRSDTAIMGVADRMKLYFQPQKAPKNRVVIQYLVKSPDGVVPFHVTLDGGHCDVQKGTAPLATVTLGMSLPSFLRLASGKLGGLTALMTGRLDVSGEILLARKVQGWFQ